MWSNRGLEAHGVSGCHLHRKATPESRVWMNVLDLGKVKPPESLTPQQKKYPKRRSLKLKVVGHVDAASLECIVFQI